MTVLRQFDMKRMVLTTLGGIALLTSVNASAATLLQYQFDGLSGVTSGSIAASGAATGITGLAFSRVGLTATSATDGYSSSGWTAVTNYLTFGFNVAAGSTASVTQLAFGGFSSGTGPVGINVFASTNGGTSFSNVGSFLTTTSAANLTVNFSSAVTSTTSIIFRFVANPVATNGAGTFRVTDTNSTAASPTPFTIVGTVSSAVTAVPEPATWGMMIVGFGLAGGAMRRRAKVTVRFA